MGFWRERSRLQPGSHRSPGGMPDGRWRAWRWRRAWWVALPSHLEENAWLGAVGPILHHVAAESGKRPRGTLAESLCSPMCRPVWGPLWGTSTSLS